MINRALKLPQLQLKRRWASPSFDVPDFYQGCGTGTGDHDFAISEGRKQLRAFFARNEKGRQLC